MPRPLSWLPRLAEIRRSVTNSARSHYERKDIERLFQIQRRQAQELIQRIAPSAKIGRSFLLESGALQAFLDAITDGADPASLLAARSLPPAPRRRLRELVQVDQTPATLDTAPSNITFQSGQLSIDFASMEQLAGALLALAEILENPEQFATFENRYVPRQTQPDPGLHDRAEVNRMFAELEEMERNH